MRTETLANLSNEEVLVVRSVEQQIVDALTRIAKGVSVRGLSQAVGRIVETTERYMARLDRISHVTEPAPDDGTGIFGSGAARIRSAFVRNVLRARATVASKCAQLTSREAEVLRLIAEGFANKQIAAELSISVKTVEKHRQNMMAKLDLHDTAGVTRYAISAGIVSTMA